MTGNLIRRHVWLIDLILSSHHITFEQINHAWIRSRENETGAPLSKRTFLFWKNSISEEFGINIKCNRATNTYSIEYLNDLKQGATRHWLLNNFAVGSILGESEDLRKRVRLEDVPGGQEYIKPILEAMRTNHAILITHHLFGREAYQTEVEPYSMILNMKRWYLLGNNEHQHVKTYALDRIEGIRILDRTFELPEGFDVHKHHEYLYGIMGSSTPPRRIRLKVDEQEANYLRSLPLHHSQRELRSTTGHAEFEVYLKPTYDFIQKVLSLREHCEVLSPKSFRNEIKNTIKAMLDKYK